MNSTVGEKLRNASASIFGRLAAAPIQVLVAILVARSLGAAKFGTYNFALEFSFIFVSLSSSGFRDLATREMSRQWEERHVVYGALLQIKLISTALLYALMVLTARMWGMDPTTLTAVYILGAYNLLRSFVPFLIGVFRSQERMEFEGLITVLFALMELAAVAYVVYILGTGQNLLHMASSRTLALIPTIAVGFIIASRWLLHVKWNTNLPLTRFLLRELIPIALAGLLLDLFPILGILMLQKLSTPVQLGFYALARRLISMLNPIPAVLSGAWFPELSRTSENDMNQFVLHSKRLFQAIFLSGILITIMLIPLAEPVIHFLFGEQYAGAVPVFRLFMIGTFVFFVNFGAKTILQSKREQGRWFAAVAAGLVVNLVMNLLWVPESGAYGAAQSFLCANLVIALFSWICIGFSMPIVPIAVDLGRITLAGGLMGVAVWFIKDYSWIAAGLLAPPLYFITLYACRAVDREEIRSLFRLFTKREPFPYEDGGFSKG